MLRRLAIRHISDEFQPRLYEAERRVCPRWIKPLCWYFQSRVRVSQQIVLIQEVLLTRALTLQIRAKPFSCFAHPANTPGRISDHQRERGNVLCNNRSCADEAILTQGMSADNCGVGADACATANGRGAKLILTSHVCARICDVCEHTAGTAKDVITQLNAIIESHVILDLASISHFYMRPDHHVLTDRAIFTDHRPRKDMAEMPDPGAFPYLCSLVHVTRDMNHRAGKARIFAHLCHAPRAFAANGWMGLLPLVTEAFRNVDTMSIDERTSFKPKPRPATTSS